MSPTTSQTTRASELSAPPTLQFTTVPDKPLIVIEPRRLSAAFGLRELWAYR
jgi:hypothetical protein